MTWPPPKPEATLGTQANLALMRRAHLRAAACQWIWWRRRHVPTAPARQCGGVLAPRVTSRRCGPSWQKWCASSANGRSLVRRHRPHPLRRADGRLPARHRRSRRGADIRGLRALPARRPAARRSDPGRRPAPMRPRGAVCDGNAACPVPPPLGTRGAGLRACPAGRERRILSAGGTPRTCGSPPATNRTASPRPCSACCTRPATPCMSAACRKAGLASRWARPPAWPPMNPKASSSRCRPAVPTPSCAWLGPELQAVSAATRRPTRRTTWPACGGGWSAASSGSTPTN